VSDLSAASQPPRSSQAALPRWAALLALAGFVLIWLGALAGRSLVSADEGRYASLSLAMLQSGDWVTPRLNGLLYFEKPPLQYWAGALSMGVLGINEFAARLWPGLAGLATVCLLGFTARRLWGGRAGLHAFLIGGGTTWIVLNSHFLSLDAGLTAALTLVLCSFLLARDSTSEGGNAGRSGWFLLAWAGVGLAVLSKGLVGLIVPGAALLLHSLWRRDFTLWRHLRWAGGLALLLAITVPWFALVSARNPDFASFFFIHEHFQRFLTPVHRREGAWWYFLPFLLAGFLPWTGSLPWILRVRSTDFAGSFALVWAAFILLFFSVSSSKLPSYILPMFPALVLLLARKFGQVSTQALRWHLALPMALWAAALVCVPLAQQLMSRDTPQPAIDALLQGVAIGAVLFLLGAAAAWWLLRQGRATAALALVAAAHLCAILIVLNSHNSYGQLKSSDAVVRALAPHIAATTPVFAVRAYDHTLPFYLRRPVVLVDVIDEFEFGQTHEPQRWLPTLDGFVTRWQAEPRAAAYMSRATRDELAARGLAMRVVFEDPRRLVVVKP
jgi:4-amino-4-deoxy-L-arabinose transferase-like glycosyltransferase